jgi:transketolase
MLNESLKLNPELFNKDVKKVATRVGYGEGLVQAARENEAVVGLCADLTESTNMHKFAKEFPHRFIQMGVAEQNMAAVASGMAHMGKIPFIASYAMFSPGRNWEQIRTTICYNDAKVIIAGAHAGISVGPDGGTHQALEDIAIMRVIPNITILYPADNIEAKKATISAAKIKGPVYIRLARVDTPVITTEETPFEIGKAQTVFESEGKQIRVGIIATGPLVYQALMAAKELDDAGTGVKVLNLSTIKPLPVNDILDFVKDLSGIVTLEEHQVAGGMGSAVSELLSQHKPIKISFLGVQNKFGQSGTPDELIEHYGMGINAIKEKVKSLLQ